MLKNNHLPFTYLPNTHQGDLTGFAGLPLYHELMHRSGLSDVINTSLNLKVRGWSDLELISSLIFLNIAGGDCISDIERLENDKGFNKLLTQFATLGMKRKERRAYEKRWRTEKSRSLPSNAAVHRFLSCFHNAAAEKARIAGRAFIPARNKALQTLMNLNRVLINCMQKNYRATHATLDQDATLTQTSKKSACFCYKKYKAYQPLNTYWAESGMLLHSEFRDGNVPAGYEQLRVFEEAVQSLPSTINSVSLRSDSAAYQEELINYCMQGQNERFGPIDFAIAASVCSEFKACSLAVKDEQWFPITKTLGDGRVIETGQEWAEVNYLPDWAIKNAINPRFIAIREKLKPNRNKKTIDTSSLPFQTIEKDGIVYKLFALVTNKRQDGNTVINWHRERCGNSEHVHSAQKSGFAGGQMPSNKFGQNAAWWQIMILAFNLNRLMQVVALPKRLKNKKIKSIRYHLVSLPGCVVSHARKLAVRVEQEAHDLFNYARQQIARMSGVDPPLVV